MPLSGSTMLNIDSAGRGELVFPSSLSSEWVTVLAAGLPATQDAAVVTNPDADISASLDRIFKRPGGNGTTLLMSLAYDDGLSAITDPVVRVFGRMNSDGRWMSLRDVNDNHDITLATDVTNDDADGAFKHSALVKIDCLGCNEFVVAVQTALDGTGTKTTAYIEGKIV